MKESTLVQIWRHIPKIRRCEICSITHPLNMKRIWGEWYTPKNYLCFCFDKILKKKHGEAHQIQEFSTFAGKITGDSEKYFYKCRVLIHKIAKLSLSWSKRSQAFGFLKIAGSNSAWLIVSVHHIWFECSWKISRLEVKTRFRTYPISRTCAGLRSARVAVCWRNPPECPILNARDYHLTIKLTSHMFYSSSGMFFSLRSI